MSDHDASPKEWTQAHSLRHGPQRWLSKQQRKQLHAQQAYIANITSSAGGKHTAHFGAAATTSASAAAAAARRRSSLEQQLDRDLQLSDEAAADAPSTSRAAAALAAAAGVDAAASSPTLIEEGLEESSESDDEQRRDLANTHRGAAAMPAGHKLQRLASAPVPAARSLSNVDEQFMAAELMQVAPHQWCHCSACTTAAAHQRAAQQAYLHSLRAHSARASPSPHSSDVSRQSPQQMHPSSRALSLQLSPSAAMGLDAHTLEQHASELAVVPPASSKSNSALTPQRSVLRSPTLAQKTLLDAASVAAPSGSAAVASVPVGAPAPSPSPSASPAPSASPSPPPPLPLSALLPRWFLIILSILKETDGRDKLAKCVQYGGRVLAIVLRKMHVIMWWVGFVVSHVRNAHFAKVWKGIQVLLLDRTAAAVAVVAQPAADAAVTLGTVAPVASIASSAFATTLRASYAANTGLYHSLLLVTPGYSAALSKLDVLTAALSSGRRMIRVVKWTYTLPSWAKTFASWKTQMATSIEEETRAQEEAEKKEAERKEQERMGIAQQSASSTSIALVPMPSSSSSSSSSVAAPASSSAAPFRFSHPHPPHLWRRLPWLTSVELLDLTLAVATDMSDDLEWLSKYKLFPAALGERFGRIAMCLWFSTVILDLSLTARIVLHYRYQKRELSRQIAEVQREFSEVAQALAARQEERQHREMRRAHRRELQHSPLFKQHEQQTSGGGDAAAPASATSAEPVPASNVAASSPSLVHPTPVVASSAASDASWSVLSDAASAKESGNSSNSSNSSGPSSSSSTRSSHESDGELLRPSSSLLAAADANTSTALLLPSPLTHDSSTTDLRGPLLVSAPSTRPGTTGPEQAGDTVDDDADDDDPLSPPAADDQLHSASVRLYRQLGDLRAQSSANRVSLFLQYLNFAKFAFDLGCAAPMAWNVHKEHDALVQSTGLVSGLLGVYKLAITIKPAA